jgi:tripartite-type tricarboxylate transporter receptor subunit TctC
MKLARRQFLPLAASFAAIPPYMGIAWAQSYPSRPVRILAPSTPGGSVDIVARLIGQWLAERLGQPFVIENRPSAGGNLAVEAVVRGDADGYTLLLIGVFNAINATLYDKLNFNFIRDIAPVGAIGTVPNVLVVHPSVPARTVPELIAYAKSNPHRLNMASGGNGSPAHVAGELFKMMANVDLLHVPYRGATPALTDLLGGQVQVFFGTMPATIEYIRAGKLRPLAITTATRSDALLEVPTIAEFLPGFEASSWYGLGAHQNTPAEIVDKLNREINAGLADPKIKARLANVGVIVLAGTPAEFAKRIAAETEKWGKLIKAANIKPD